MKVLAVENLSQNYGGLKILQDISFDLKIGEKVGLIGPNGAGKTTLLNVLSGILPHSSGRIFLNGHDVTNIPPYKRVTLGLGRSFQINTLFMELTLLDNTLIAVQGTQKASYTMLKPVIAFEKNLSTARKLLEPVDLWEKRGDRISILSYGEQRQLEILLALASKPKLLLLDEPNAGLSSGETVRLITMIQNMVKDVTLFFSAHDMDLVFDLADRVIVLYNGTIIAQGTPQEIQSNQRVRAIYLGKGRRNA